jgi:hypothetical protein
MLDNLSQPVAFATAPLARLGSTESAQETHQKADLSCNGRPVGGDGSSSSDENDFQVGLVPKYNGRTLGLGQPGRGTNLHMSTGSRRLTGNSLQEAMEATIIPSTKAASDTSDPEEVLADEGPSRSMLISPPFALERELIISLRLALGRIFLYDPLDEWPIVGRQSPEGERFAQTRTCFFTSAIRNS